MMEAEAMIHSSTSGSSRQIYRHSTVRFRYGTELVFACIAILVPVLLPAVQFGLFHRWWTRKREVDRKHCSCSCWDMIFKGSYEMYATGYKHVYFNVTYDSLLIWASTVAAVVALYECTRYLLRLTVAGRLRVSAAVLVIGSVYPHYYTWWMYFNAHNDDYYEQFYHQALFSITEIVSTCLLVPVCAADFTPSPRRLVAVAAIAAFHIVAAAGDQFLENVVLVGAARFQSARDIAFMCVDAANFVVPCVWLCRRRHGGGGGGGPALTTDELGLAVVTVVLLWMLALVT